MNSKKCKDYPIECIYCDPKLEVHLTTTKEAIFKHCRVAHNVEEQSDIDYGLVECFKHNENRILKYRLNKLAAILLAFCTPFLLINSFINSNYVPPFYSLTCSSCGFYRRIFPTVEIKTMRRSSRLAKKQAKSVNETQREPKAKKNRRGNSYSNSATFDNGTLVEAFKFLNYCQLANNSLVSKRFWNLVRTHRHSLPLLYVYQITMLHSNICQRCPNKLFKKNLIAEEYNEWVIRNHYSKQIPLECQVAKIESSQDSNRYAFRAEYKDPEGSQQDITLAFLAAAKLSDDNWPLFQHFVSLFTDPFIYIGYAYFFLQNDDEVFFLKLLTAEINLQGMLTIGNAHFKKRLGDHSLLDRNRLRCEAFQFGARGNNQKFMGWIKDHVLCDEFQMSLGNSDPNYDAELLELLVTGTHCTSEINVERYDLSKVVSDFAQKFMDLKNSDENQMVKSIQGRIKNIMLKGLKRKCTKFIVEKEEDDDIVYNVQNFEFINNDIGKKLQITVKIFEFDDADETDFVLTINNL